MRLLVLTTYYPPEVSAASVRISQITKRFSEINDKIIIKTVVFNPLYAQNHKAVYDDGIDVCRYRRKVLPSFAYLPQSINPVTLISWIIITSKEIAKFGPDLVLTSSPPFAPAISIYIVSKILRNEVPYIVDYRDDLTSIINNIAESKIFFIRRILKAANIIMSSLFQRSLKGAYAVSTVNEVLQEKISEFNERAILVQNGLDLPELKHAIQSFNREEVLKKNGIYDMNSKIIIYLGDLNMSYYMPEIVLKPLKKLNDMGYHLIYVIVGDGKRKHLIKKMAEDLDLQDSVYLLGRKKHEDALELLLASDVAFYSLKKGDPQSKHAIGTKVYEYIGCKLPILAIADDGSAISNFINKWGIGYFLSWNSLEGIDDALKELLDSYKFKDNLNNNYQYFIDMFDRNLGIDFLYKEIIDFSNSKS